MILSNFTHVLFFSKLCRQNCRKMTWDFTLKIGWSPVSWVQEFLVNVNLTWAQWKCVQRWPEGNKSTQNSSDGHRKSRPPRSCRHFSGALRLTPVVPRGRPSFAPAKVKDASERYLLLIKHGWLESRSFH